MDKAKEKAQGQQIPCPLCKGNKVNGFAVCAAHKATYNKEAASVIYEGGIAKTYEQWLIQKLEEAIPSLETEVTQTREGHNVAAQLYDELLCGKVREKKGDQTLDPEVLRLLKATIIEKDGFQLRKQAGEPTAFYEKRTAELRLQEARRISKELKQKAQAPEQTN